MMPSAAMWILLETAMLSELRKRQISLTCEISKKGINELIYKTEIESQMQKINLQLPGGEERDRLGLRYKHYYIKNR